MKKIDIKNFNLKDRWHDKRERAKIELVLYGIFFLIIIVFVRVSNLSNSTSSNNTDKYEISFINSIEDNYKYNINVNINNRICTYNGMVLGYNSIINRKYDNNEDYFYKMNDKYYILDDNGNYILTSKDDIYSIIDYNYLDINTIKEYIKTSRKEDNKYIVKISDIVLNSDSIDSIIVTLNEDEKKINIDYTNLLKIKDSSVNKAIVDISYSDIDKVISLAQ